jgi:hypothetical protein
MRCFVACCTQRNQILFDVVSQLAARLKVVNLQIFPSSTTLATPAVAPKHLAAQATIGFRLKP